MLLEGMSFMANTLNMHAAGIGLHTIDSWVVAVSFRCTSAQLITPGAPSYQSKEQCIS